MTFLPTRIHMFHMRVCYIDFGYYSFVKSFTVAVMCREVRFVWLYLLRLFLFQCQFFGFNFRIGSQYSYLWIFTESAEQVFILVTSEKCLLFELELILVYFLIARCSLTRIQPDSFVNDKSLRKVIRCCLSILQKIWKANKINIDKL